MGSSILIPPPLEKCTPERDLGPPGGNGGEDGGLGGGGGGWDPGGGATPSEVSMAGVWVAIAAIVMLFAALTGVMMIRKRISEEWVATALPPIVYWNSVVLLVSSLTLEFSRGSLTAGISRRFFAWLYVTLALGVAFVAGQVVAWRELAQRGIYLATDPSSSFFYLLTGVHALHLLGGIIALVILVIQAPKIARGLGRRTLLDGTAVYWHFMYGLWVYILLLLVLKV
jgi:cytochrome c oxidase subunit III